MWLPNNNRQPLTSDVRKQNEALRTEVNAARTVAAEDQKKLARINAATRSGEMTAEQAQSERARIADDSKHLETIIQHLETQQGNYQSAGQQLNQTSADYTRQLADMKGQIDIMKRQKETLDRAISASG